MMTEPFLAASHHTAAAFNADFYTVASTVIPVLFLAIAVQGTMYEELLKAPARTLLGMTDELMSYARRPSLRTGRPLIAAAILNAPIMILAIAIVIFGAAGEAQALLALYWKRPVGVPLLVLIATLFLAAAAVAGPFARLVRLALWFLALAARTDREAAAENARAAAATPPPTEQQPPNAASSEAES